MRKVSSRCEGLQISSDVSASAGMYPRIKDGRACYSSQDTGVCAQLPDYWASLELLPTPEKLDSADNVIIDGHISGVLGFNAEIFVHVKRNVKPQHSAAAKKKTMGDVSDRASERPVSGFQRGSRGVPIGPVGGFGGASGT